MVHMFHACVTRHTCRRMPSCVDDCRHTLACGVSTIVDTHTRQRHTECMSPLTSIYAVCIYLLTARHTERSDVVTYVDVCRHTWGFAQRRSAIPSGRMMMMMKLCFIIIIIANRWAIRSVGRTNVRPASYAVSGERTFANGNAILGTFVPPCPWPQPRPAGKGTDAQAAASLCCASRTSTPTSLRSGCVYVRIHIGARRPTAFRFRCL